MGLVARGAPKLKSSGIPHTSPIGVTGTRQPTPNRVAQAAVNAAVERPAKADPTSCCENSSAPSGVVHQHRYADGPVPCHVACHHTKSMPDVEDCSGYSDPALSRGLDHWSRKQKGLAKGKARHPPRHKSMIRRPVNKNQDHRRKCIAPERYELRLETKAAIRDTARLRELGCGPTGFPGPAKLQLSRVELAAAKKEANALLLKAGVEPNPGPQKRKAKPGTHTRWGTVGKDDDRVKEIMDLSSVTKKVAEDVVGMGITAGVIDPGPVAPAKKLNVSVTRRDSPPSNTEEPAASASPNVEPSAPPLPEDLTFDELFDLLPDSYVADDDKPAESSADEDAEPQVEEEKVEELPPPQPPQAPDPLGLEVRGRRPVQTNPGFWARMHRVFTQSAQSSSGLLGFTVQVAFRAYREIGEMDDLTYTPPEPPPRPFVAPPPPPPLPPLRHFPPAPPPPLPPRPKPVVQIVPVGPPAEPIPPHPFPDAGAVVFSPPEKRGDRVIPGHNDLAYRQARPDFDGLTVTDVEFAKATVRQATGASTIANVQVERLVRTPAPDHPDRRLVGDMENKLRVGSYSVVRFTARVPRDPTTFTWGESLQSWVTLPAARVSAALRPRARFSPTSTFRCLTPATDLYETIQVEYVPHVLTAVLAETSQATDPALARSNARQKVNRHVNFPWPDVDRSQLQEGTLAAVAAVQESGFQGRRVCRHVKPSSLVRGGKAMSEGATYAPVVDRLGRPAN